jgi:hypothetical protein
MYKSSISFIYIAKIQCCLPTLRSVVSINVLKSLHMAWCQWTASSRHLSLIPQWFREISTCQPNLTFWHWSVNTGHWSVSRPTGHYTGQWLVTMRIGTQTNLLLVKCSLFIYTQDSTVHWVGLKSHVWVDGVRLRSGQRSLVPTGHVPICEILHLSLWIQSIRL